MPIEFTESAEGVEPGDLEGFFDNWAEIPSADAHLRLLKGSTHIVLAMEGRQVVGFINAITDGVLNAHIPLLEVLPTHRGQGIGKELVRRMLLLLEPYYAVDLTCEPELRSFYSEAGLRALTSMCVRRPDKIPDA